MSGDELHAIVGQVVDAADVCGIVFGCDQDQTIAREDAILTRDRARLFGIFHLSRVGTGEHVRAGALAKLRGELAGGAEIEGQLGIRIGLLEGRHHVLEDVGQR